MDDNLNLSGLWIGDYHLNQKRVFCQVRWNMNGDMLTGKMELPFEGESELEVSICGLQPGCVQFQVINGLGTLTFDGQIKTGMIVGSMEGAQGTGEFHLTKIAQVDPKIFDDYAGSYELEPGHVICVANFRGEMGCDYPVYLDLKSGDLRALFPQSRNSYLVGEVFLLPYPHQASINFSSDANGRVTGLNWQAYRGKQRWASRIPFKQEAVSFTSQGITLAGTLTMPISPSPHPAVILTHGSGAQLRDHSILKFMNDFFALNGLAVLAYDKRGVGASEGDWNQATLSDLAQDVLAGVAYLQAHRGINTAQIGIWGLSQGGWLAPLAAAQTSDVAFIIIVSAPAVSVAQQDLDRIEHTLRSAGFSEDQIQEALTHQRLFFQVLETGTDWDKLEASIKHAESAPWKQSVFLPPLERVKQRRNFLKQFWGYDPIPDLERVCCPVIAIFGGMDTIVPAEKNLALMEEAFQRSGNMDWTVKVFPDGDHTMGAVSSGAMSEIPYKKNLVPGYLDAIADWLHSRFGTRLME